VQAQTWACYQGESSISEVFLICPQLHPCTDRSYQSLASPPMQSAVAQVQEVHTRVWGVVQMKSIVGYCLSPKDRDYE
jgi:hypothetical protein